MAKLVIKSHRPWQMAIAIIALSMLMSALTWFLLDKNHWDVIYDELGGNNTTKQLLETNQQLQEENRNLTDRVFMLEQTTQLDQDTAVLMQSELKSMQDQIYQLKRELEFYQGVMDTTREVLGLEIHGIYVEPLAKQDQYMIKIILTNVARNDRVLGGDISITLEGSSGNRRQRLNMNTLLIDEVTDLSFQIKSFKRVEYGFQLPSEFTPERVIVTVKLDRRNDPPISRTYDWPLN